MPMRYNKETKERLLKKYKEGEYKSLRSFSKEVNISSSTISTWLKSERENENEAVNFALVQTAPAIKDESESEANNKYFSTSNIKLAFAGVLIEVPTGFEKKDLKTVMEVLGEL